MLNEIEKKLLEKILIAEDCNKAIDFLHDLRNDGRIDMVTIRKVEDLIIRKQDHSNAYRISYFYGSDLEKLIKLSLSDDDIHSVYDFFNSNYEDIKDKEQFFQLFLEKELILAYKVAKLAPKEYFPKIINFLLNPNKWEDSYDMGEVLLKLSKEIYYFPNGEFEEFAVPLLKKLITVNDEKDIYEDDKWLFVYYKLDYLINLL